MAFAQKFLDVQFQLAQGSFDSTDFNVVTLGSGAGGQRGIGASAHISRNGTPSLSKLELVVRGMTLSQINQLTTLGKPLPSYRNNVVTVTAYEDGGQKSTAFSGTILEAWFNGEGIPNATFNVSAQGLLMPKVTPAPPQSYSGATDINQVMSFLAAAMGLNFVNDGVTGVIAHSPYFAGTLRVQAETCARQYNFNIDFDDTTKTLIIWPKGSAKSGSPVLISKATGMVGYPRHTDQGIEIETLYNPNLTFGCQVKVVSDLAIQTPVTGQNWAVFSLIHELEAGYPEASKWFSTFKANYYGAAPIIGGVGP